MLLISIMAAICSTLASVPQLLGHTHKLSNITMALRGTGSLLWTIYGILRMEYALIAASGLATLVEIGLALKTNCEAKPSPNDTGPDSIDAVTAASRQQTWSIEPGTHD